MSSIVYQYVLHDAHSSWRLGRDAQRKDEDLKSYGLLMEVFSVANNPPHARFVLVESDLRLNDDIMACVFNIYNVNGGAPICRRVHTAEHVGPGNAIFAQIALRLIGQSVDHNGAYCLWYQMLVLGDKDLDFWRKAPPVRQRFACERARSAWQSSLPTFYDYNHHYDDENLYTILQDLSFNVLSDKTAEQLLTLERVFQDVGFGEMVVETARALKTVDPTEATANSVEHAHFKQATKQLQDAFMGRIKTRAAAMRAVMRQESKAKKSEGRK